MFVLMGKSGRPMACSYGCVYYFQTSKEAARIVDICYGFGAFKYGWCKIRKLKIDPKQLPIKYEKG